MSNIAFVPRRRRCARCEATGPEKPEVYSLEYVEDFFGPRKLQMVADRSPQQNGYVGQAPSPVYPV